MAEPQRRGKNSVGAEGVYPREQRRAGSALGPAKRRQWQKGLGAARPLGPRGGAGQSAGAQGRDAPGLGLGGGAGAEATPGTWVSSHSVLSAICRPRPRMHTQAHTVRAHTCSHWHRHPARTGHAAALTAQARPRELTQAGGQRRRWARAGAGQGQEHCGRTHRSPLEHFTVAWAQSPAGAALRG